MESPYGDYKHHVGHKKGILQEYFAGKSSGWLSITSDVLTEYHWLYLISPKGILWRDSPNSFHHHLWDFSSPEDIDYQLGLLPTWRLQSNWISTTSTNQATDSGPYGKGGIFTATQVTRRGSGPSSAAHPNIRKDSTLGCLVVKNRKGKTRLNHLNLGIAKKKIDTTHPQYIAAGMSSIFFE